MLPEGSGRAPALCLEHRVGAEGCGPFVLLGHGGETRGSFLEEVVFEVGLEE